MCSRALDTQKQYVCWGLQPGARGLASFHGCSAGLPVFEQQQVSLLSSHGVVELPCLHQKLGPLALRDLKAVCFVQLTV